MANYKFTNVAGTSRRRARQIVIENPSQKAGASNNTGDLAKVTFVMEDRIIMADGSEMFNDVGLMTIPINMETLSRTYPNYDINSGEISSNPNRNGNTLVSLIMDALEDVFITEGMISDSRKELVEQIKEPTAPSSEV